ncbi:glycosyltransferase family 4 protein [Methanococcus maripaludis]|uniref:Glycosyltransferase family 4 protein n=2 Tax=Methanococcus maripaludis TaxID=39152 RepID=A0A8T3W579_METMI|nr:glycosyltransferase family 4 protein [Methanococcus maripaludis]AEK20112.1 glycosyl transferase group 1 [Methanococcus maripaludis X1]MBG0768689.1 glycosyltransferase family 4 protein [Methanococcus maripaludis]
MKILIITEYFPSSENCDIKGGVEARAFYFAKNLAKKHDVTVITSFDAGTLHNETISGINVIRCGKKRNYSHGGNFIDRLSFIFSAIKTGKRLDVDIVDGYNFISYIIAYKISKFLNIPRVATYHDVWIGEWIKNMGLINGIIGEILERYVLSKKWDKFIAVSKYTKQKLKNKGIREDNISVAYNGIDLENYNSSNDKEENTICYVGRLVKYKKVDDLIKAVKIVKNDIPNIKLNIVGSGPEEKNLKKIVTEKNLEDNVKFLGFLKSHSEVMEYLKRAKLFSLPSVVEGFGMVTIEAVACTTPYVNSKIPPTVEITHNGLGGILYEPENISELSDSIKCLLNDNDLYLTKQVECKNLSKNYDWKELSKILEKEYLKMISK